MMSDLAQGFRASGWSQIQLEESDQVHNPGASTWEETWRTAPNLAYSPGFSILGLTYRGTGRQPETQRVVPD